jgi:hypothetical protein
LVNLDEILMVQPGQGTGSAILFGREHLVPFGEDFATVIRRIQTGPYIQPGLAPTPPKQVIARIAEHSSLFSFRFPHFVSLREWKTYSHWQV